MATSPFWADLDWNVRPTEQGLLRRIHIDAPLLLGLLVLCGFGLMVLYSAGDQNLATVERQLVRLGIAFGLMLLIAQIPPTTLRRWSLGIYGVGVVMLIAVLIIGEIGKGAQRWLDLGVVRFQPSELLKLAVPMTVAWLLSQRPLPPRLLGILLAMMLTLFPVVLIAKQPDLGTSLLVASAGILVLFIAGLSWRMIIGLAIAAGALAPLLWMGMHDYQRDRVMTFLNPESDPLGTGYHIIQSQIAIGSGGISGKGWLNGTQSHLEFLPERHTDFIFAVIGEEFGFTGIVALLGLYLFIIFRGLMIAARAESNYDRLLAGGLTLVFFVYLFVNTGMVTGLLPVVGVPLPLISYGGTSMVTLMAGFGMLMAIETHKSKK
ncbi:rod shape-determining protein RodA [Thiorhodococcus mannitoliphagus]|uniref:Peptidoglycan glycosyltransferase MrdB n=1 Tax=Thiorhodococcus mannitoliphagus TaxID=329406 RepID=A0A6P1DRG7_9GAMM|nr:rod shape-determining protein RodA [Thiorhodococcus mannitoliphagus]NEX20479.1 rod shape-determining protein RodA [Thiorhodococcus mannitoliphagus]